MKTDRLTNSIRKDYKKCKRKEIIKQYKILVKRVKMASNAIDTRIYLQSANEFSASHIALRLFLFKNKGFKIIGNINNPAIITTLEWGKTNNVNW